MACSKSRGKVRGECPVERGELLEPQGARFEVSVLFTRGKVLELPGQ